MAVNADFLKLPAEILEKIFLHLPTCQILDIALVCKTFNEVIGSSIKLMNGFHLEFKKSSDLRIFENSVRKYRSVNIENIQSVKPKLQKFLSDNSSTLTSIGLYDCSFQSSFLHKLLEAVAKNLETISMCEVNFEVDSEVVAVELPRLQYMEIMYGYGEGYSSIMNFFSNAINVDNLLYEDNRELDESEVNIFSQIISNYANLTRLSISFNISQKIFSNNDFTSKARFHLSYFHFWLNAPSHVSYPQAERHVYNNLLNFIDSQRASLINLTLARCTINTDALDFLLSTNLEDLGLVYCELTRERGISITNTTIKNLFISEQDMIEEGSTQDIVLNDVMNCCKAVKKLRFSNVDITFEMSLTMTHKMKNLKQLSLFKCIFVPSLYPNLRKLVILAEEDLEDSIRLIRMNRQLKELQVPFDFQLDPQFEIALSELSVDKIEFV